MLIGVSIKIFKICENSEFIYFFLYYLSIFFGYIKFGFFISAYNTR